MSLVDDALPLPGDGGWRHAQADLTDYAGQDVTIEEGNEAARTVAIKVLATLKEALGDLDRVKQVVKTLGMVNATPDFADHVKVINGYADLLVDVFGEKAGKGARSAVGMGSLPGNICV